MKSLTLLLALGLASSDKLDRTYLPPPGSKIAGGSDGAIQVPLEFPKETFSTTTRPLAPGQQHGGSVGNVQPTIGMGLPNIPQGSQDLVPVTPGPNAPFGYLQNKVPTTTTTYAFTQTTTFAPPEGFETTVTPIGFAGFPSDVSQDIQNGVFTPSGQSQGYPQPGSIYIQPGSMIVQQPGIHGAVQHPGYPTPSQTFIGHPGTGQPGINQHLPGQTPGTTVTPIPGSPTQPAFDQGYTQHLGVQPPRQFGQKVPSSVPASQIYDGNTVQSPVSGQIAPQPGQQTLNFGQQNLPTTAQPGVQYITDNQGNIIPILNSPELGGQRPLFGGQVIPSQPGLSTQFFNNDQRIPQPNLSQQLGGQQTLFNGSQGPVSPTSTVATQTGAYPQYTNIIPGSNISQPGLQVLNQQQGQQGFYPISGSQTPFYTGVLQPQGPLNNQIGIIPGTSSQVFGQQPQYNNQSGVTSATLTPQGVTPNYQPASSQPGVILPGGIHTGYPLTGSYQPGSTQSLAIGNTPQTTLYPGQPSSIIPGKPGTIPQPTQSSINQNFQINDDQFPSQQFPSRPGAQNVYELDSTSPAVIAQAGYKQPTYSSTPPTSFSSTTFSPVGITSPTPYPILGQTGNIPGRIYRPERPQAESDRNAEILNYKNIITPDGEFEYSFDTSNGIHADENGTSIDGVKAEGSYSYTGDDGKLYSIVYSADENGFRPQGAHLPTPPPIPEAIQKVIEQAARDKEAGIAHDGFYDEDKYGHMNYQNTNRIHQQKPNKFITNGADIPSDYDEIVQPGQVKPGSVKPGKITSDQVRPGELRPNQVRPGQVRPGEVTPGQIRSEEGRPAEVIPGQGRPGQVTPGQVRPSQFRPGQVRPYQVRPAQVRPGEVILDQERPGKVTPGIVRPGQVRPDKVRPGQVRPGQVTAGEERPDQIAPSEIRPGQVRPGLLRPGQVTPDRVRPGQFTPGNQGYDTQTHRKLYNSADEDEYIAENGDLAEEVGDNENVKRPGSGISSKRPLDTTDEQQYTYDEDRYVTSGKKPLKTGHRGDSRDQYLPGVTQSPSRRPTTGKKPISQPGSSVDDGYETEYEDINGDEGVITDYEKEIKSYDQYEQKLPGRLDQQYSVTGRPAGSKRPIPTSMRYNDEDNYTSQPGAQRPKQPERRPFKPSSGTQHTESVDNSDYYKNNAPGSDDTVSGTPQKSRRPVAQGTYYPGQSRKPGQTRKPEQPGIPEGGSIENSQEEVYDQGNTHPFYDQGKQPMRNKYPLQHGDTDSGYQYLPPQHKFQDVETSSTRLSPDVTTKRPLGDSGKKTTVLPFITPNVSRDEDTSGEDLDQVAPSTKPGKRPGQVMKFPGKYESTDGSIYNEKEMEGDLEIGDDYSTSMRIRPEKTGSVLSSARRPYPSQQTTSLPQYGDEYSDDRSVQQGTRPEYGGSKYPKPSQSQSRPGQVYSEDRVEGSKTPGYIGSSTTIMPSGGRDSMNVRPHYEQTYEPGSDSSLNDYSDHYFPTSTAKPGMRIPGRQRPGYSGTTISSTTPGQVDNNRFPSRPLYQFGDRTTPGTPSAPTNRPGQIVNEYSTTRPGTSTSGPDSIYIGQTRPGYSPETSGPNRRPTTYYPGAITTVSDTVTPGTSIFGRPDIQNLPSTTYRPNYTIIDETTGRPITVDASGRPVNTNERPGYSINQGPIQGPGTSGVQTTAEVVQQNGPRFEQTQRPGFVVQRPDSQVSSTTQRIIGEDFSGPKQPQRFDPETGYHY